MHLCFLLLKLHIFLFTLLLCSSGGIVCGQSITQDGLELLLNSLKNQGDVPSVFHSGVVEFIVSEERALNEADYQRRLESHKKSYGERMEQHPDIYKLPKGETLESSYRKQYLRTLANQTRSKVTFRGATPYSDVKQEFFTLPSNEDISTSDTTALVLPTTTIGNNIDRYKRSMFLHYNVALGKNVYVEANRGVPFVSLFGRARGERLTTLTALLLLGGTETQITQREFHLDTVKALRESNRELLSVDPKHGVHIFAEQDTDEGHLYGVLIPGIPKRSKDMNDAAAKMLGKCIVWINPEKGYITPLIEEFLGDVCVARYESRDYFQDKSSKLWYPKTTIDTVFNDKGEQVSKTTYEVDVEKTKLNIDISDDEFVFPIKAGWSVTDRQTGIQQSYRTVRDTKLEFNEKGRIAFSESRDFVPDYPVISVANAANVLNMSWPRILCIVLGFVMFAYGVIRLRKNAMSKKG